MIGHRGSFLCSYKHTDYQEAVRITYPNSMKINAKIISIHFTKIFS